MKVYISADIEGVSGVVNFDHTTEKGSKGYETMRRRMTREVAMAARGALQGGATEVVVSDSHADGTNIIHEELPREVKLVQGTIRPLSMMEGIDNTFSAVFFVGYHAMRGTFNGTLNHSFSGRSILCIRINNDPVGEMGLNAGIAGAFNVPLVLVTGDEAVCTESSELIKGVHTVAVKRGIGMLAAESRHPDVVCAEIEAAAKKALNSLDRVKPYKIEGTVRLEIDFVRTGQADAANIMPGVERTSPNSIAFEAKDFVEAYRALDAIMMISWTFPA